MKSLFIQLVTKKADKFLLMPTAFYIDYCLITAIAKNK